VSEDLGSGYFSDRSRVAAVQAALPFVATYFVSSGYLQLRQTEVLGARPVQVPGRPEPPADPVLAALRLRAALVAGEALVEVLRLLLRSANFRLDRVTAEHVGHLHGRLDIPRYLQQRGRRDVPRRYPVVDLQRSTATPENVLAAFALHWFIGELDSCLLWVRESAGSPEHATAARIRAELVRLGTHPTLRVATPDSERIARRESVGTLLDTVQARLHAGHVTRTGAYEQLTGWVRSALLGQAHGDVGKLAAAFYGPGFDNKLFELWCLVQLKEALQVILGPPTLQAPHLLERDSTSPLFSWDAGASAIELCFQPALTYLTGEPNGWRYHPDGQQLKGYPDLGVRCRRTDGSIGIVLLDAKLRRRLGGGHGQEIYKLLGYLANSGAPIGSGALIFHEPAGYHHADKEQHWTLKQANTDGTIEIVAVDPSDPPGTREAFAHLARLIAAVANPASRPIGNS
jgi:hypothetical protein